MIGSHYSKTNYNCAHFVMDYYDIKSNLHTFTYDFIRLLKTNFVKINTPDDDCLVVMTNLDGSLHVGIHKSNSVIHNWAPGGGSKGSVIITPLTIIKLKYHKIRFYRWLN